LNISYIVALAAAADELLEAGLVSGPPEAASPLVALHV
jgi:hypothetical protein